MRTKSVFFLFLGMTLIIQPLFSQDKGSQGEEKEQNKKLELKFYGFIKGDMVYAAQGVYSWGDPVNNYVSSPQFASGVDEAALGFTAQHSRIGLRGSVGEKIKVGGVAEIDFYGGPSDANTKPRLRLAYASVATGGFELRVGQQWDLISPNNANTVNTNGNLWFGGNIGFRRAQFQASYTLKSEVFAPMLQLSVGEAAREATGLGKDNLSAQPMIQARLSGKILKKYTVGVAFAHAAFKEKKGTPVGDQFLVDDFIFNTTGFGVDVNLPFHKYFSLTGEFNTGTNLNNANLFSAAGNYYWTLKNGEVVEYDRKSTTAWFNATSEVTSWLNLVVGYGMDNNTSSSFKVGAVEKNTTWYADAIFPIKHGFSVTFEYQNIVTTMVKGVDSQGEISERSDNDANVISLSAKVNF
ncbi:MAG TPA: hypothetical protein PKH94_03595 [Bacteroidales bacterium]|nr:hypothetical protein [Bacteroidales bacterium]HNS46298.1 hypothetical protein [Bacteroidales bacterium]